MTYAAAFCIAFVLDWIWAKFQTAFKEGDRPRAVLWNAAFDLAGTVAVWLLTGDRWTVLPSLAGGALGLWLGMGAKEKGPPNGPLTHSRVRVRLLARDRLAADDPDDQVTDEAERR